MVDETADKDPRWTDEQELEAMVGLIDAFSAVMPSERDLPPNLNYTSLNAIRNDPSAARSWLFERVIMNAVRRYARDCNERVPGIIDPDPIKEGLYNGVRFIRHRWGSLSAERSNGISDAEFDGLVRLGERIVVIETKVVRKIRSGVKDLNLEGKLKVLNDAFPGILVSVVLVHQPVEDIFNPGVFDREKSSSNYTLVRRPVEGIEALNRLAPRIHQMALPRRS